MRKNKNMFLIIILIIILNIWEIPKYLPLTKAGTDSNSWVQFKLNEGSIVSIVPASKNSSKLYLCSAKGIFFSEDRSKTFAKIDDETAVQNTNCFAVDPRDPNIIYLGNRKGISHSLDGGKTWNLINRGFRGEDITSIVVNPIDSSVIYTSALFGGLFCSIDRGESWKPINNGLPPIQIMEWICLDPNTPTTLYAGVYGAGIYKSINSGKDWFNTSKGLDDKYLRCFAVDPNFSNVLYTGSKDNGIFKSTDGGENWSGIGEELSEKSIFSLIVDSEKSSNLYLETRNEIYYSKDNGKTWKLILEGLNNNSFQCLALSYADAKTLYVGTLDGKVYSYNVEDLETPIPENDIENPTILNEKIIIFQLGSSKFTVNGVEKVLDTPLIIKNNYTLVPIRNIVKELEGKVTWNAKEKKVGIFLGSISLEFKIGDSFVLVNGQSTPINVSTPKIVPEIINGSTMLPLRFLSEKLGCTIAWEKENKKITIKYKI